MNLLTKTATVCCVISAMMTGCGGGGGGSDTLPGSSSTTPGATVPPNNSNPASNPPASTACTTAVQRAVLMAYDGGSNDGHGPELAIDGDLEEESRWSAYGEDRWIIFDLGEARDVREVHTAWYRGDLRTASFDIQSSLDASSWSDVALGLQSQGSNDFGVDIISPTDARYLRIVGRGNSDSLWNSLLEVAVYDCGSTDTATNDIIDLPTQERVFGPQGISVETPASTPLAPLPAKDLFRELAPASNFDLSYWYVSVPTDTDNSGTADSIYEERLNDGYQNPDFFYTADDGGMVFKCPVEGFKTSTNTSYPRVELREMLRNGDTSIRNQGVNKNNWVFSSAPAEDQTAAAAVDGNLRATLAVNHVTTTGDANQVGRVIIAQIHANDDEPMRLYYRKLPGNSNGSIYFAHEPIDEDDLYVEMVGTRSQSASDPEDGIALNEVFSYEIDVQGNILSVSLLREGKPTITHSITMQDSGYDQGGQYMYFKAGAYNQNNSGLAEDYVQVTFYALEATH